MINKNKIFLLIILILSSIVLASIVLSLTTTYNPFTGRLDYIGVQGENINISGYNITATNFFGNFFGNFNLTDSWVNESGDTMTGNLNMSGNNIFSVDKIGANNVSNPSYNVDVGSTGNIMARTYYLGENKLYLQNEDSDTLKIYGGPGVSLSFHAGQSRRLIITASVIEPYLSIIPYYDLSLNLGSQTNRWGNLFIGNITVFENLNMTGKNITQVSWLKQINTIIGNGDNIRIGDASTDSHSLTSDDDLYVSGKLEVDGLSYFDSDILIGSEKQLQFGNNANAIIQYDTSQAVNSLLFGTNAESNTILIVEKADEDFNFAHAFQTNPTIFIHSASQSTTQWGSLSHDTNNFNIDVGGIPSLTQNNTKIWSRTNLHQETLVEADLSIGSEISNYDLFAIESNGTNIILKTYQSLPLIIETYTINGTAVKCYVNETISWVCV